MNSVFKRILLVDHNIVENFISSMIVKNMMITQELAIVQDGRQAINYIKRNCASEETEQTTLVLIDCKVGLDEHFEFINEFGRLNVDNNVKVVVLSDHDQAGLNSPFYYLTKPLTQEKIHIFIEHLFGEAWKEPI